jgi:hypothetical protein
MPQVTGTLNNTLFIGINERSFALLRGSVGRKQISTLLAVSVNYLLIFPYVLPAKIKFHML